MAAKMVELSQRSETSRLNKQKRVLSSVRKSLESALDKLVDEMDVIDEHIGVIGNDDQEVEEVPVRKRRAAAVEEEEAPVRRRRSKVEEVEEAPVRKRRAAAVEEEAPVRRRRAAAVEEEAPVRRRRAAAVEEEAPAKGKRRAKTHDDFDNFDEF
jgi:hypothetical protein